MMLNKINIGRAYIFSPSIHIVFRVEISGHPQVSSLEKAIRYATSKYEILNCRILQDIDGDFFYVPKQTIDSPNIEIRNYHQDAQEFINEQERIRLDLEKGELVRFIIADDGEKIVLNIVQHHLAGDGKSILILLEDIMTYLDKIENGDEESIKLNTMIPIKMYTPKYMEQHVEINPLLKMTIDEMNKKWRNVNEQIFTYDDACELFTDYWKLNKTKVATVTIPAEAVENYALLCRENGVTVNNAIITSISRSINRRCKICVAVNMRTNEEKGMGNYAECVLLDIMYDASLNFWENANKIQQLMKSLTADRGKLFISSLVTSCFDTSLRDATYFQMMNKFHSSVIDEYNDLFSMTGREIPFIISNLGLEPMKTEYGRYRIEEVSFFSPLSIGFNSNMGVITQNGKMVINMQYNDCDVDYQEIFDELKRHILYCYENDSFVQKLAQCM